jgi:hypothetical protein
VSVTADASAPSRIALVVGGGPVGLVAALSLYSLGFRVSMVEKRPSYIRTQILRLDPDTLNGVLRDRLLGRAALGRLNSAGFLNAEKGCIKVSDLEYALAIRAETLAKEDPDNFSVYYGFNFLRQTNVHDAKIALAEEKAQKKSDAATLVAEEPQKPADCDAAMSAPAASVASSSPVSSEQAAASILVLGPDETFYSVSCNFLIGSDSKRSVVRDFAQLSQLKYTSNDLYASVASFENGKLLHHGEEICISPSAARGNFAPWIRSHFRVGTPERQINGAKWVSQL